MFPMLNWCRLEEKFSHSCVEVILAIHEDLAPRPAPHGSDGSEDTSREYLVTYRNIGHI